MGTNLVQHRPIGAIRATVYSALYSCETPANLLIAVIIFSVASLFSVEVLELPIFKLLALICLMLAAVATAQRNSASFYVYAAGVITALVLVLSGAAHNWAHLKDLELWLIKPLVFISIMVMVMPLLVTFDYSNPKFQRWLTLMIVLLMATLFVQAALLVATKEVFDFQAALGLSQTRSHNRLYSFDSYIDVHRLSGIAIEPAIYCMTMFCMLMLCNSRVAWAVRILAEVSIGICLAASGWIMLGVLFYRNYLLMTLGDWLKSTAICLLILIPSLLMIYPPDASKFTLFRIVCPQIDPSANARLLAYIPENISGISFQICEGNVQNRRIPSEEEIRQEAMTSHQRGSNLTFISSAFGIPGTIVHLACIFSLVLLSRRFLSLPIFVFSFLLSALTEPIFWLGFLGCALLIREVASKQIKPSGAMR